MEDKRVKDNKKCDGAGTGAAPDLNPGSNPWTHPGEHYNFQDMSLIKRVWGHFCTITTHKFYVAQGCFKLGLYYQGITHDLSKYSLTEFTSGVRYFDGHRSPNAVERSLHEGLSTAWLHHKGRNRHHFEYWIDYSHFPGLEVYGNRMPLKYVAEMVCDRRAACITYQGKDYTSASPWVYFDRSRGRISGIMHRDTYIVLENCLYIMKEKGEEAAFEFIRGLLRVTRGNDYTAESLGLKAIGDRLNS